MVASEKKFFLNFFCFYGLRPFLSFSLRCFNGLRPFLSLAYAELKVNFVEDYAVQVVYGCLK